MEAQRTQSLFFPVRVVSGKEINIIRLLLRRISSSGVRVRSITFVPKFKGYLFVEAEREYEVRKLIAGLSKLRLASSNPIPPQEMEDMIASETAGIEIEPGDIVRIIKGNFKGYRAVVIAAPEGGRSRMLTLKLLDIDRDWEVKMPVMNVKLLEKGGGSVA
ncbi:MAG: hypothetical protein BA066_04380 [Candidatus Korarchaeota archaeon NZ13-K]|nr:MAG: hypothetical protein BA066_04380 [Candidatus Korarchaeota archaeon NZ13-K]